MEILQTICNVLTTQNERLTNIIISPFLFVEVALYMLIFLSVLGIPSTSKQRYTFTITCATLAIINILFIPVPYYTFVNVLIYPLLVFLIFKVSLLKSLLSEITMYIISLIVGTPLVLIFSLILNANASLITTIPLYRLIYSFTFYLFLYIFYKCIHSKNISLKSFNFNNIKLTNNTLFIVNFILGILSIGLQFYIEFAYIDYIPMYIILPSIFVLLAYFVTSIYSLYRTNRLEATTKSLEEEKLYNQTLTVLYDKIRGFKHDFNNIVQGIGGYISTNNMEGLKEYYSQVLDDCQRVNNLALLSPDVINNPAIYSLITAKYHKAMEYGIKIDLEVFMDLTNINLKIYLLTRALGILIDNAIEAAKDSDEKEIIITFRKDIQKHKQLFIYKTHIQIKTLI